MSYCVNPFCQNPFNSQDLQVCGTCGTSLLLNHRYIALRPLRDRCPSLLAVDTVQPMKPMRVIQPVILQGDVKSFSRLGGVPLASSFAPPLHRLLELGLHPQIPNQMTQFEQNSCRYLVQEFIEGRNLAQELALEGSFSEVKIRRLLVDLLPLLQLFHRQQLAHGDIKPANLIRRSGTNRLFLVDLRSVRVCSSLSQFQQATVLHYQDRVQTAPIMPFIADLQALGATCIHLLTQIPMEHLLDSVNIRQALHEHFSWSRALSKPVSPALLNLLNALYTASLTGRYTPPLLLLEEMERSRPLPSPSTPYSAVKVSRTALPAPIASANYAQSAARSLHTSDYSPPSEAYVGSVDETLPPNWWMLD